MGEGGVGAVGERAGRFGGYEEGHAEALYGIHGGRQAKRMRGQTARNLPPQNIAARYHAVITVPEGHMLRACDVGRSRNGPAFEPRRDMGLPVEEAPPHEVLVYAARGRKPLRVPESNGEKRLVHYASGHAREAPEDHVCRDFQALGPH